MRFTLSLVRCLCTSLQQLRVTRGLSAALGSAWKHQQQTSGSSWPSVHIMGGGQSTDSTADLTQKSQGCLSSQDNEPPRSPDTEHGSHLMEPDSELPQRRICSKNVDDMSFMISCTNWY